jgi:hypothetical protein
MGRLKRESPGSHVACGTGAALNQSQREQFTPTALQLQVRRLRQRLGLSEPLAITIARLAWATMP